MATPAKTRLNGIDVDQLMEIRRNIQQHPELAKYRFHSQTKWVDGGHTRTTIQSFYKAGQEDHSRTKPFVLEGDQPPALLGSNQAPNALEAVLHAVGSSLASSFVYNAAAQGIKIDSLDFSVEGDVDMRGLVGVADPNKPTFDQIQISYRVKSPAANDKIQALWDYVQKTTPVLDIIRNPTPVKLTMMN